MYTNLEDIEREIELLKDQSNITLARKKAEKKYENLTNDEIKFFRAKCKNDLFFLSRGPLGYNKLSPNLHGDLCTWLKSTRGKQFREILLPRGHYKSTICTISDSIQIALPDDSNSSVWPRNIGTSVRILIAHETDKMAGRFLFSISSHFLSNPALMGLFPECIPNPRIQRINKQELELPREEHWGEPTFDTMGVGGKSQGRHYNFLKLDDLFGDKARDSQAERETTYQWFDNIQSFFSSFAKDRLDLIGTRWAFDDLYSHAHAMYGDLLVKYIRGAEEWNEKGERVPIFPEEFPPHVFTILKKNKKIYSANYANDPTEGATEFDKSWKRHFIFQTDSRISLLNQNGQIWRTLHKSDLDITFLIDPATEGLGGLVICGVSEYNDIILLETIKSERKVDTFTDLVFKKVRRWWPRLVVVEKVLFSVLFEHWWKAEMKLRGIRFNVESLPIGTKDKNFRIRKLSNYFCTGHIFQNINDTDFDEEYDSFGASENVHLLDALSMGPNVWRAGLSQKTWQKYHDMEQQMLNDRDASTGYSRMEWE